jgi:hypothetical protein
MCLRPVAWLVLHKTAYLHVLICAWYVSAGKVIFTITGGATDFDWSSTNKDMCMKELMTPPGLKPIFVTGGSDSGIMKYVGEARAKFNPKAVKTPAHFEPVTALASLNLSTGKVLVL